MLQQYLHWRLILISANRLKLLTILGDTCKYLAAASPWHFFFLIFGIYLTFNAPRFSFASRIKISAISSACSDRAWTNKALPTSDTFLSATKFPSSSTAKPGLETSKFNLLFPLQSSNFTDGAGGRKKKEKTHYKYPLWNTASDIFMLLASLQIWEEMSLSLRKKTFKGMLYFCLYLINKSMNVYLQKDEEALTIKGFDPSNWVGDKQNTLDASLLWSLQSNAHPDPQIEQWQ